MAPAIHRDRGDVAIVVEASFAEHAGELVAHPRLEVSEREVVQDLAATAETFPHREVVAPDRRHMHEMEKDRLLGRPRTPVVADRDGIVELQP